MRLREEVGVLEEVLPGGHAKLARLRPDPTDQRVDLRPAVHLHEAAREQRALRVADQVQPVVQYVPTPVQVKMPTGVNAGQQFLWQNPADGQQYQVTAPKKFPKGGLFMWTPPPPPGSIHLGNQPIQLTIPPKTNCNEFFDYHVRRWPIPRPITPFTPTPTPHFPLGHEP